MKYRCLANAIAALTFLLAPLVNASTHKLQVLLQGSSSPQISELVLQAGGTITHDLHIINAIGAKLTRPQLDSIIESPHVTRYIDDLVDRDQPLEIPKKDDGKCKVRGHIEADFSPNTLSWSLYNKRQEAAQLSSVTLAWPPELGPVTKIAWGKDLISTGRLSEQASGSLSLQFPETGGPMIDTRETLTIEFTSWTRRNGAGAPRQRDFTLDLQFTGGCTSELVPGYENNQQDYYYNSVAGVDALHRQGITGKGVTVAVLDSGLWNHPHLMKDTAGNNRVLATYNALNDTTGDAVLDESGHGTHMASIIANSGQTLNNGIATGTYKGVAPDANLIALKVLDREGFAHLLDIIRAIQWATDNREKYRIRVLNLSFAQFPRWPYWEDPVDQAVMQAWAQGIAVVAAAGNEGPDTMTIGSPGNVPYVITVGAVTDSWTPRTRDDDYIPDFSSRGPTPSGHIKPDVVALGGHMTGLINPDSQLAQDQPEDRLRSGEFVSTGSSQASALVSGVLAILLQLEPDLSPDDLKCKLLSSAEPAINRDGLLSYSPFQQGYGFVNTVRAITLGEKGCGNNDLDIRADLSGEEHFYGPAIIDAEGNASLHGYDTMVSGEPSEKGFSEIRRWGIKDHIERRDYVTPSRATSHRQFFDWEELYLLEKDAIEQLGQEPPPRTGSTPLEISPKRLHFDP